LLSYSISLAQPLTALESTWQFLAHRKFLDSYWPRISQDRWGAGSCWLRIFKELADWLRKGRGEISGRNSQPKIGEEAGDWEGLSICFLSGMLDFEREKIVHAQQKIYTSRIETEEVKKTFDRVRGLLHTFMLYGKIVLDDKDCWIR
jgi:hypothetical protein